MIQLKGLVSSILNSFLGPNKSNKFIIQDKDVSIARCPLYIFQNIHFQDPVSSLVEETLFAHHDLYGCSTLSLLAMWYFWHEEFKLALDEGSDIQNIIMYSQTVLEQVISALSDTAIKLDQEIKNHNLVRMGNKIQEKIPNKIPVSIQYSSRHFSPCSNSLTPKHNGDFHECLKLDESYLKTTVRNLDHDEDFVICDLVLDCWKRQISISNCSKFKTDGLLTCPILLPCFNSTVIDGLLIKSNLNQCWYEDRKNVCTNRSLVIKGSITYEYVHLGFSPKISISFNQASITTRKEIWLKKTCDFIKQLKLNVLLVKDDIDSEIASFCSTHSVLILSHIPLKLFKILCEVLQYSPCTYIWDCDEENIIRNLVIKEWKPSDDITLKDKYVFISVNSKNILQTIVLCHPSQAILEKMEHQVHHLTSRLALSFKSNTLLPGEGKSEEWCFEFLRKLPQFHDLSDPTSRVLKAFSGGFKHYAAFISRKMSLSTSQEYRILDEMSSKMSAWQSALSLVLLTLQYDTVIMNGIDDFKVQNLDVNTL